jgi:hypothetical protein
MTTNVNTKPSPEQRLQKTLPEEGKKNTNCPAVVKMTIFKTEMTSKKGYKRMHR